VIVLGRFTSATQNHAKDFNLYILAPIQLTTSFVKSHVHRIKVYQEVHPCNSGARIDALLCASETANPVDPASATRQPAVPVADILRARYDMSREAALKVDGEAWLRHQTHHASPDLTTIVAASTPWYTRIHRPLLACLTNFVSLAVAALGAHHVNPSRKSTHESCPRNDDDPVAPPRPVFEI
jgi:hypothetical protein